MQLGTHAFARVADEVALFDWKDWESRCGPERAVVIFDGWGKKNKGRRNFLRPTTQLNWLLLAAQNCVFGGFGNAEFHHALSGNLDGFASRGIASHSGFAVDEHQFSQTRKGEGVLSVFVSQRHDRFDRFSSLFFGQTNGFRNRGGDL